MSSDESPAVVELPGDALEVIRRRSSSRGYGEPGVTHEEWARSVLAEVYPLIAARVCAEAVAERARLISVNQSLYADLLRAERRAAEAVAAER